MAGYLQCGQADTCLNEVMTRMEVGDAGARRGGGTASWQVHHQLLRTARAKRNRSASHFSYSTLRYLGGHWAAESGGAEQGTDPVLAGAPTARPSTE
jgi:hypothetical protein